MNLPLPNFFPLPSSETMLTISIVSLIVGICLVCLGATFNFLHKRKEKKTAIPWISICVGILLMADHGSKLLFKL